MKRRTPSKKLREKAQNAERAMEAARLKRAGLTLKEIGAKLGCCFQRAHVLVHQGIDAYHEEAKQEIAKWIQGALVELTQAQDEAWIQWQRSKQNRERRTIKTTKDGSDETEMTESQCGDVRYLAEIRNCIHECAKLLGVFKRNFSMTQQVAVGVGQNEEETKLRRQLATMLGSMLPPPPGENIENRDSPSRSNGHAST
jgi:hypothetical protein